MSREPSSRVGLLQGTLDLLILRTLIGRAMALVLSPIDPEGR